MTRKQKHPRKSKSCTECRRRRKNCDGQVPGCCNCRQRNVAEICCWGDERDLQSAGRGLLQEEPTSINNIVIHEASVNDFTPASTSSVPSSSSDLDTARIQLMNVLAQEDAQASREDDEAVRSKSHARQEHSTWRLPTYSQAKELLSQHQAHLSVAGLHWIDYAAIHAAFDVSTGLIQANKRYDVIALLLFVCASAISVIPATYSITMGLVRKSEDIDNLGDTWINAAWEALDESDQYTTPTMEGVQAIVTYQYNLAVRGSRYRMVNSMDQCIRASRQLGLDRLGSHESDKQIWAQEGDCNSEVIKSTSTGWWAVETLKRQDWKAREFGRCQWMLLLARDWAANRQMGTYSIHPYSFTTQPPKVYVHRSCFDIEREEVWPYLLEGAEVLRCFGDLCADINTRSANGKLSYESVLLLDAQIVALLEKRPAWMQVEKDYADTNRNVLVDVANNFTCSPSIATTLSCTLWQRLYVIHRPFLALSISDPKTYGLSAQRTFDNAMLFLKASKQVAEKSTHSLNQTVLMIHLHQAALVIITHLLLSGFNQRNTGIIQASSYQARTAAETVDIHSYLDFAIAKLKTSRLAISNIHRFKGRKLVFEGVGERLETLLAACITLGKTAAATTSPITPSTQFEHLAELDAKLEQLGEISAWTPDDHNGETEWLAANDSDWQHILHLLS